MEGIIKKFPSYKIILVVDFNVPISNNDFTNKKLHLKFSSCNFEPERKQFKNLIELWFFDAYLNEDNNNNNNNNDLNTNGFTWYSYRQGCKKKTDQGWRIYYFLVINSIKRKDVKFITAQTVDFGDHAPIILTINNLI